MKSRKRKTKRFDKGGPVPSWMNEPGLEPVYLEEMIPLFRAARGVKAGAEGGLDVLSRIQRAKNTVNQIHPDFFDRSGEAAKYAVRNLRGIRGAEELEDIRRTGRMLPPAGKDVKYFTSTSREGTQDLRVPLDKVPPRGAVRKEDVEVFNKQTGKYEPFKKGGKVKASSASKRADGCAQRGKTKGRFV
jgi:hypothetical protein